MPRDPGQVRGIIDTRPIELDDHVTLAQLGKIGVGQTRPHMFDLYQDYPAALVPRSRRIEVSERITAGGEVLTPLSQHEIERAVDCVRAADPQSCAVCFLFAFQNPEHERAIADALRQSLPDIEVSASSEVQPEFREFERFSNQDHALNESSETISQASKIRKT